MGKLAKAAKARGMTEPELLEALLREAESINGAARLIGMSNAGFKRHMRKWGIEFSREILIKITHSRK